MGKQSGELIHNLKLVQVLRIIERFSTNFDHVHQASHRLFLSTYTPVQQNWINFPHIDPWTCVVAQSPHKGGKITPSVLSQSFCFWFRSNAFWTVTCVHTLTLYYGRGCYFSQKNETTRVASLWKMIAVSNPKPTYIEPDRLLWNATHGEFCANLLRQDKVQVVWEYFKSQNHYLRSPWLSCIAHWNEQQQHPSSTMAHVHHNILSTPRQPYEWSCVPAFLASFLFPRHQLQSTKVTNASRERCNTASQISNRGICPFCTAN